jgi:hypothetical protein
LNGGYRPSSAAALSSVLAQESENFDFFVAETPVMGLRIKDKEI